MMPRRWSTTEPVVEPLGEEAAGAGPAPDRGTEIRRAAMDLLARREHARRELSDKLLRRFGDAGAIARELDRLRGEGLQSDDRFAEAFIHSRAQRLYGPQRIVQELRQRGVDADTAAAALRAAGIDWLDNLRRLQRSRFGAEPAPDAREQARRQRFLQYRGFTPEQVRRLLGADADWEPGR
jgi:regulatory protein